MTGDKIVAVIVPRLVTNPAHRGRLLQMAGLWLLIIVAITVVVVALR